MMNSTQTHHGMPGGSKILETLYGMMEINPALKLILCRCYNEEKFEEKLRNENEGTVLFRSLA